MRAYILVGKSKRLPNKHLIKVVNGKRLIDLVVENLRSFSLNFEIVIYSKYPIDVNAKVIIDTSEWILPSVISLLGRDERFFLFGGDMPFIKEFAVKKILDAADDDFTVIPRWSSTGFLEPLHGLYTKKILPCFQRELERDSASLTHALSKCPFVKFISAEELGEETFFNVNTREDLEKLKKILYS